ncbi:hypothetical protein AEAC466_06260 [Asticcacaulis sp. AC466]|uniref:TadE/TadG family type IV pilus assembly protein n=1 Tax=Asticcacaulis sp. AC466 TaxID=1282362 RepID=UPI0003C3D54B|nr:TadE/TadG family type IV pilus assembly protein [Asticcacaulis sp. AC466]ESQ84651.1 hypothetical protein AEAC466_06260 [Asticcacaulis sp. AC466]
MISLRRLNHITTLKAFGRKFARDNGGVSAIEFALVAPILVAAYLGLAELTLGMMASRRASHLAATIGDLAAQSETLTTDNISDLWQIGKSMLPDAASGTSLKMRLTSVTMDATNHAIVNWSVSSQESAYPHNKKGAQITAITTTQIAAGESLVMTEIQYDYTSPLGGFFVPTGTQFKDVFYHHPRSGTAVQCPSCPTP